MLNPSRHVGRFAVKMPWSILAFLWRHIELSACASDFWLQFLALRFARFL